MICKIRKTFIAFFSLIFLCACSPSLTANVGEKAAVLLNVSGVINKNGSVLAAICDKKDFLKKCIYTRKLAASSAVSGVVHFHFDDLPLGKYSIMVFHDENNNGYFDTSSNGIPIEGYGFSKNIIGHNGPPSFDETAINLVLGPNVITIEMLY